MIDTICAWSGLLVTGFSASTGTCAECGACACVDKVQGGGQIEPHYRPRKTEPIAIETSAGRSSTEKQAKRDALKYVGL